MSASAAARSCFSNHRFDGGAANCLRALSFSGGLDRRLFILSRAGIFLAMRVSFARALGIAFSFLIRVRIISPGVAFLTFPSSASLGGGYVLGACPRPHHLVIISCGEVGRSCRPRVPLHLIGVISSHRDWLSCGGRRALPLISRLAFI